MARSGVEIAKDLLEKASDGEDPWLMSYADLVTNLLAFMVLLVSMAGISFESIDAVHNVFDGDEQPPLRALSADVLKLADAEGLAGKVVTDVDQGGLEIRLQDRILLPSGVDNISTEGQELVGKLARLLSKLPERYRVVVEGHTDDVPIATAKFRSNWDLSASRAIEVRNHLSGAGVRDGRLTISAFAETQPVKAPADLPLEELRRRNRRVVIRVYY